MPTPRFAVVSRDTKAADQNSRAMPNVWHQSESFIGRLTGLFACLPNGTLTSEVLRWIGTDARTLKPAHSFAQRRSPNHAGQKTTERVQPSITTVFGAVAA